MPAPYSSHLAVDKSFNSVQEDPFHNSVLVSVGVGFDESPPKNNTWSIGPAMLDAPLYLAVFKSETSVHADPSHCSTTAK